MATKRIEASQLDTELQALLADMDTEVREKAAKAIDRVATRAKKEVVEHAPVSRHTSKKKHYKQNIALKKEKDLRACGHVQNIIYVKAPDYALAHLLEHGHAIRGGAGRVPAYPHFAAGENYIKENLDKEVRKEIENG